MVNKYLTRAGIKNRSKQYERDRYDRTFNGKTKPKFSPKVNLGLVLPHPEQTIFLSEAFDYLRKGKGYKDPTDDNYRRGKT